MNITDEDRQAAERFNVDLRANLTGTQLANLAGILAKHRISALEQAAKVAESVVVGKPAYTREDHRKPKVQSMSRIAIAEAIRNLK